ncbi:hypothetical protein [Flavobacterium ovatum]|jgi:hypothetical protein|uniref:hypothetical protein n=1 Tax=Flavobacterium ovatum TaxID=1928857 RepID=UPI00344FDB04
MKLLIVLVVLMNSIFILSQNRDKRHVTEYLNMTSFSISKNFENYYFKTDKDKSNGNSFGFDLNTIHGIKFFERMSVSAGLSLDWNINRTFLSTPYIIDFRVFSNRSMEDGFFAYLQTGKNIKWSSSFDENGGTSKLGIGIIVRQSDKSSIYLDLFKKSKQIETDEFENKGTYRINGFGLSMGVIF